MGDDQDAHATGKVPGRSGVAACKPASIRDGVLAPDAGDVTRQGSGCRWTRRLTTDDKEVDLYGRLGYAHARLAAAAERMRPALAQRRGQGTVEYVALVLLVSLVMLGVVAAMKNYNTGEGQELGDLILKKIKEAVGKVRY